MNSTSSSSVATDALTYVLTGVGRLFYIVSPKSTMYGHYKQVPDYITESIPFFVLTITLEFLALVFKDGGKGLKKQRLWNANRFSVNDLVGSIGVSKRGYDNIIIRWIRNSLQAKLGWHVTTDIKILFIQFDAPLLFVRV